MESWKFLHQRIIDLFKDSPPGFFIEAGALDGQYLSNTLHLEKEYGWTGLLVEPNPSSYNELLKKNRRCYSSNTCLAVTPYPKEMVLEMMDTREQAATSQAMWVIRGGSFLQEGAGRAQMYQANTHLRTYAVAQCFPFITYWKALNLTKVDLFSLDVEGAEQQILSTIPWDSMDIKTLILEHYGSSSEMDKDFVESIETKGYSLYDYNVDKDFIGDYIFVKKELT
ncbi:protein Star-like [Palaemon carinicauda]|uniref:protein Star-like n=1 Tax=Palaemon carinicauda TaxID=392227 RepID=UPI0035B66153